MEDAVKKYRERRAGRISRMDADFRENDHPRDENGRFASGGGGGANKSGGTAASEARERMISRTSKQSSVAGKPARDKYVDDKYFSPMNKAERESDVIDILGKASKDPKVSGWSVKSMADEWMEKRSFDKVERESFIKKLNKAGVSM